MGNKPQFINPDLRKRLFTEIMHTGINAGAVVIPADLREHAAICPMCSAEFTGWVQKADVGRILTNAREIVRQASEGDPTVHRREYEGRRFYFKPAATGTSKGTLVTTDNNDSIIAADEGSLEDFLRLG